MEMFNCDANMQCITKKRDTSHSPLNGNNQRHVPSVRFLYSDLIRCRDSSGQATLPITTAETATGIGRDGPHRLPQARSFAETDGFTKASSLTW